MGGTGGTGGRRLPRGAAPRTRAGRLLPPTSSNHLSSPLSEHPAGGGRGRCFGGVSPPTVGSRPAGRSWRRAGGCPRPSLAARPFLCHRRPPSSRRLISWHGSGAAPSAPAPAPSAPTLGDRHWPRRLAHDVIQRDPRLVGQQSKGEMHSKRVAKMQTVPLKA